MSTPSAPPPGTVTGAVVLARAEAVLLVLGGIFVILSGWLASDFLGTEVGRAFTGVGAVVIVAGVLHIVAAGQLRAGKGRALLAVMAAVTVAGLVASALTADLPRWPTTVVLLAAVPALVALVLTQLPATAAWVAAHRG
jgi:hypothetical protein